MYGIKTERINLQERTERAEVEAFLQSFGLILDQDVDYTLVVREGGTSGAPLVATCSKTKSVLKCFAVQDKLQGEGIAAALVTALIDRLFYEGLHHCFIFTKPTQAHIFQALNFKLLHRNEAVALLENGIYDVRQSVAELKQVYALGNRNKTALVMNCNPFTLGHYYLIEQAARGNREGEVLVFVVEEEQSEFPFPVRYELVRQGVTPLKNVKVLPGGEYIISAATFPSYFLREEGERLRAFAELDASIFGKYFCSPLQITRRYVGDEPFCRVTRAYNQALQSVLPAYGVEVREVRRMTADNQAISASQVRAILQEVSPSSAQIQVLCSLLPEVTLQFLATDRGKEIVEKIRKTGAYSESE